MLRNLLLSLLLCLPLPAQTGEADLEAALAAAPDARAARDLLARAFEKGQGAAVVRELEREDRLARWLDWKKGPPGDPLTEAAFGEPAFIRLLAGRLDHGEASKRLTAARYVRWSGWPYLVQAALERLSIETDGRVLAALFDAMRGSLKDDELRVAWRSVPLDEKAAQARLRALFRLGLARAGLSHRVAAWPGGADWVEKGFSADRSAHPYRKLLSGRVSLSRTKNRDPVTLLLGFRYDGEPAEGESLRVLDGSRVLAEFKLGSLPVRDDVGADPADPSAGLRIAAIDLGTRLSPGGGDLVLEFSGESWRRFEFRALVGFERALLDRIEPYWTRRLVPGPGLEVEGAEPDDLGRGGLLLDSERAVILLDEFQVAGRIHSFELDHWSDDPGGSVWELRLNGVVLMQLIGQPRPRAAKASLRNLPLEAGRNRLVLRRLSGSALHVEAVRLRFE